MNNDDILSVCHQQILA